MANNKLSLALAKVMIAAAWADGEVQPEETEFLKKFVTELPYVNEDDWEHLDVYMSMPIEENERLELMEDLRNTVKNDIDKQFVVNSLKQVFMADGVVSEQELRTIEQIKEVLRIEESSL